MSAREISIDEKFRLKGKVISTFTPGRPIKDFDLLAGRNLQIDKVFDAVLSPGQHAAIYGDRGVGKSSLANLIYDMIFASGQQNLVPIDVNCAVAVSFPDIWAEVFRQIEKNTQIRHLLANCRSIHLIPMTSAPSLMALIVRASLCLTNMTA